MSDRDADDADDKRRHERKPIVLRVDYDGAVTTRELAIGTLVRLVLSFPGLLQPITVEGVVRWTRGQVGELEPGVGIEFTEGPGRVHLTEVIDRLRRGDSGLTQRIIKVLLVEDNPHVADLIREGLRGSGSRGLGLSFDFREARNGREALDFLESERFDVMIVDIYLPLIDGAQVITKVRTELGLGDLPVIAVSAGGEHAHSAAMAAGANIFLDKPMRLRQVIETMRSLMKL
jgi:CheY-like chemotaxis protein